MPVESVFSINPETISYHDPDEVKKVIQPLFNIVEELYKENQFWYKVRRRNKELGDVI